MSLNKETKKERTERLHAYFRALWDNREDEEGYCYCFETNSRLPLSYRCNTCCYHHILPKSKYPQYEFESWNIVILHPDIHTRVEGNVDLCPKVAELTRKLKEKYG